MQALMEPPQCSRCGHAHANAECPGAEPESPTRYYSPGGTSRPARRHDTPARRRTLALAILIVSIAAMFAWALALRRTEPARPTNEDAAQSEPSALAPSTNVFDSSSRPVGEVEPAIDEYIPSSPVPSPPPVAPLPLDASDALVRRSALGCTRRFRHCGTGPSDRCETDTANDVANCGLCYFDCRNLPHVAPSLVRCTEGVCDLARACMPGWADCEHGALDGCEANLSSAPAHCGACGHACPAGPHARPRCENGRCALNCAEGWFDCDADPATGCESSTPCN